MTEETFSFGSFQLFRGQRLLVDDGRPVPLGSRAMDLLFVLIDRAGALVTKDELIAGGWPGISVEEVNLRVHISALRKALRDGSPGNRFISNIPGRGYAFVAPIEVARGAPRAGATPAVAIQLPSALPLPLTRMIGRDDIRRELVAHLARRRLTTIAGPGGIGKTTVALSVAKAVSASYRDGVAFVDLAAVEDPGLVVGVVAAAVGIVHSSESPIGQLVGLLRDKHMLILLDSCEHVVEASALLVAALLREAPELCILATSREALRAEGEWVQRLPPLACPPGLAALTAAEALTFPAVQLFVERTSENLGGYDLSDEEAPVAADLCRKLDGIALAIELAAGRMDAFGLRELTRLLDDRFRVLARGRRTSLPRHQTLRATLDWSYDLLPAPEQRVLCRIAVFNGAFTMAAACELATDGDLPADEVPDNVAGLVAKSLLVAEVGKEGVLYRLLDTTRSYGREKLAAKDEAATTSRRHAAYFQRFFERAEAEWESRASDEWLATYARQFDNLRAALTWAFSAEGDAAVGVTLILAAAPLWSQLSHVDECLGWVERALAAPQAPSDLKERRLMQLHAALGGLQSYAISRLDRATEAWTATLRIAEGLGEADYQLRALRALWADRINRGEFLEALAFAHRFRDVATRANDASDQLIADRMTASPLHFLGDQAQAQALTDRMLARYVTPRKRSNVVRFQFDQRVAARIIRGRMLWLDGRADQAVKEIESNIADAIDLGHTLSLCNALTQAACPVALLAGDLSLARRFTALLRNETTMDALDVWHTYCQAFEGEIQIREGRPEAGLPLVQAAIDDLRRAGFGHYLTSFLMASALGLTEAGNLAGAQEAIAEALSICERTGEAWCLAEIQRVHGEILSKGDRSDAADEANSAFLRSLATAQEQKALAWELRAATSLADLWRRQGLHEKALRLLRPVLARFTEGFGTEDLLRAASLLEALERESGVTTIHNA